MNNFLPRMLLWIPLALSSAPGLAASTAAVARAELQPLTLAETLADYHEAGEIEAFQCVHVPAGKNNKPLKNAKPIAVEFDERIYLRVGGKLLSANRISSDEKHSSYFSHTAKVDVYIKRATNPSEYGESADRLMRLTVVSGGRKFSVKTFGSACGI